jgi:superfamily II DNA or RNA helicase
LPDSQESRLILEGLLGPVIGEFSLQEGVDRGVLVRPRLYLKKLPYSGTVRDLRRYSEVYDAGIVRNKALNRQVVLDAKRDIDAGHSVLILVTKLEHGRNIVDMAKRLYGLEFEFVFGATDKDVREQIRYAMIDKKIKCVVASAVFKKALDVPTLDVVINACGGKTESGTLQAIGRGSRIAEGKKYFKIRDYFNPSHPYLISHFGHRLSLYFDCGWLGEED